MPCRLNHNTILDAIEPEKKLLYDKDYIETLYRRYQAQNAMTKPIFRH
ncbi:hypothetical protein [Gallintestinimicrobium sp.]